jgi:hypothetical protein
VDGNVTDTTQADWRHDTYNSLTHHGVLATAPRLVIEVERGNSTLKYGSHSLSGGRELVEALAWQDSTPLSQFDDWVRRCANVFVTVTVRKTEQRVESNRVVYIPNPEIDIVKRHTIAEWAPDYLVCRQCKRAQRECLEHCHKSETGLHDPDLSTVTYGSHDKGLCVVDVSCRTCGVSGSASFKDEEIQWE